jgi:cytoskeletal protein CcmA (bactofilin family)
MSQASLIGRGTRVRGNVEGEGPLEVAGHVDGDVIMTGDVSVLAGASVAGSISGASISVAGAVKGDLRGTEAVLLERGARVVGDLSAPRIGIENGALVRGLVRTEGETGAAPQKRPQAAAVYRPAFPARAQQPLATTPQPPQVAAKPQQPPVAAKPAPPIARPPERQAPPIGAVDRHSAQVAAAASVAVAAAERRPPPPVVPSLGKGVKATKKKGRDE